MEVELQVDNSLMGEIIDKFGTTITTYAHDQQSFRVIETVCIGEAFFSWVFGLQGKVRIKNPEAICRDYAAIVQEVDELLRTSY